MPNCSQISIKSSNMLKNGSRQFYSRNARTFYGEQLQGLLPHLQVQVEKNTWLAQTAVCTARHIHSGGWMMREEVGAEALVEMTCCKVGDTRAEPEGPQVPNLTAEVSVLLGDQSQALATIWGRKGS